MCLWVCVCVLWGVFVLVQCVVFCVRYNIDASTRAGTNYGSSTLLWSIDDIITIEPDSRPEETQYTSFSFYCRQLAEQGWAENERTTLPDSSHIVVARHFGWVFFLNVLCIFIEFWEFYCWFNSTFTIRRRILQRKDNFADWPSKDSESYQRFKCNIECFRMFTSIFSYI